MPSFNFHKQFADDVESGRKPGTIRANRKNKPRVGQTAYLFTGMRTKNCRKLGEHKITEVNDITITDTMILIYYEVSTTLSTIGELDEFANKDGFKDWPSMRVFFSDTNGLPFDGILIKWEPVAKDTIMNLDGIDPPEIVSEDDPDET